MRLKFRTVDSISVLTVDHGDGYENAVFEVNLLVSNRQGLEAIGGVDNGEFMKGLVYSPYYQI